MLVKVFQEKDIPIQVAVGNYDLGICGLDWVDELLAKYPSSALVKVADLGYGDGTLYVAAESGSTGGQGLAAREDVIRIASEYPNLAEAFALHQRLKRFAVYPLWGAAEAYPPESADLVLLPARSEGELVSRGLVPLGKAASFSAVAIASKNSLRSKDMAEMLASITCRLPSAARRPVPADIAELPEMTKQRITKGVNGGVIRLALPDGHQQAHVCRILDKAGIQVRDYPSATGNRRPESSLAGISIKVIRPQDMPLQVANGNFDLAITGRDWLIDHKYQFPSSPVRDILDLKYGRVRLVAVVSQEVQAEDVGGLRRAYRQSEAPCRIASEYVNIADRYAREHRLSRYRIIPTWGASEAFLPEDADLLIENTETGGTIARHKLRIIDTLFESTACLIGNTATVSSGLKRKRMEGIITALGSAVGGLS